MEINCKQPEPSDITKSLLNTLHSDHITHGGSNNIQKEEIIYALGGIDEILSKLLESNATFNQKQLNSLHYIINTPHHQQQPKLRIQTTTNGAEDKGYHHYHERLQFTFNDIDIFYYSIFSKQTADNIINVLNSKITKTILAITQLIAFFFYPLYISNMISWHVMEAVLSALFFIYFIYCFGWILYLNKEAMKLLIKEFEFWLKTFFLIQYSVALIASNINNYPAYFVYTYAVFGMCFLFLVMIFDTMNIAQTTKIMFSSFAWGSFATITLYQYQLAIYRDNNHSIQGFGTPASYELSTVTTPDVFGIGSLTFNFIDICVNSAQILTIFLLKQMMSSIIKPQKSLVITRHPLMIYENKIKNIWSIKNVSNWKRSAVLVWIFISLVCLYLGLFMHGIHMILSLIFSFCSFIIVVLLMTGKIKCLFIANVVVLVASILCLVVVVFFKYLTMSLFVIAMGFGFSSIYLLKVFKSEELRMNAVNASSKATKPQKAKNDTSEENIVLKTNV